MGYPQAKTVDALSPDRVAFITRVYSLLTGCLLTAAAASVVGLTLPASSIFPLFLIAIGLIFAIMNVRKQYPLNLALLLTFSAVEGLSIGPLINHYLASGQGFVVAEALGITGFTFLSLTLYVFRTKEDFSYLGGFLFSSLIALIVVGLFGMFFGMSSGMQLMYSYFGVLVFIGYVLYDTSNLILKFSTDEYVVATMELFLDVINLFVHILRILTNNKD